MFGVSRAEFLSQTTKQLFDYRRIRKILIQLVRRWHWYSTLLRASHSVAISRSTNPLTRISFGITPSPAFADNVNRIAANSPKDLFDHVLFALT